MWVATIEASRYADGRVYVCLDGHRSDNDDPHVFVSEDFGDTFKSLRGKLPRGSSRCLREDPKNENLLYLGTEFALWVSTDRGQAWRQFNQTLPSVAIHEVAVHPELPEIVVATHGRSLWACDVSGLRQVSAKLMEASSALLAPETVTRWRRPQPRQNQSPVHIGEPGARRRDLVLLEGPSQDRRHSHR